MLTKTDIKLFKNKVSDSKQFQLQAALAKCLADPTCLKILVVISKGKKVCPSEFAEILGLSLPAVSHQLSRLKHMGIVETVRHGQMICYFLSDSKESKLIKRLVTTIAK